MGRTAPCPNVGPIPSARTHGAVTAHRSRRSIGPSLPQVMFVVQEKEQNSGSRSRSSLPRPPPPSSSSGKTLYPIDRANHVSKRTPPKGPVFDRLPPLLECVEEREARGRAGTGPVVVNLNVTAVLYFPRPALPAMCHCRNSNGTTFIQAFIEVPLVLTKAFQRIWSAEFS